MFLSSYPFTFLQTLVTLIILYVIRYTYWQLTTGAGRRAFAASHGCQPLKRWNDLDPFFGLDLLWQVYKNMLTHTTLETTQRRFEELGRDSGRLQLLGQSVISTTSPQNIKHVLSTDFSSYSLGDDRKKLMTPFLGQGIFTTDGRAWQHSRDLLRPNFTRHQITDNVVVFETHVKNVIRAVGAKQVGVGMVDLQEVFFGMSLDVATEFLFGVSTGVLASNGGEREGKEEDVKRFIEAFEYSQSAMEGKAGRWGILGFFLPDPRLKREHKVVHDFVDGLIKKALHKQPTYESSKLTNPTHYIFLHELLTRTSSVPTVRSELLNILLAGRDTTASLLSNVWFQLARSPSIWTRLQSEVAELNGSNPTYEDLKEMKYLRAILNESLRLHPVVPENGRQAERDTVLPCGGGEDGKAPVLVKKGELVAYSSYVMHRRKDFFGEDADVFKPERWIDGEGDGEGGKGLRCGWEYLPFNGGPRICIGQQFALTEAAYVTARLVQEFEAIKSMDSEPWREKLTLTCCSLGGCKVALTPRTK
ncbi:hypothetical protein ACLMJK_000882 [Lecanora helva]